MTRCYPCLYPGRYDLDALKWMKQERLLCENHEKKTDELIKSEPKKYTLNQKTFVPPIPKAPVRNWQDREPGSDDE